MKNESGSSQYKNEASGFVHLVKSFEIFDWDINNITTLTTTNNDQWELFWLDISSFRLEDGDYALDYTFFSSYITISWVIRQRIKRKLFNSIYH